MVSMHYFGYGRNTNPEVMRVRCPDAVALGPAVVQNYEFQFALHANIVPKQGSVVHGVLWRLTPRCLEALDHYEHYPRNYQRKRVFTKNRGIWVPAWTYQMTNEHANMLRNILPSPLYWSDLCEGYTAFGVSKNQLMAAREVTGYPFDNKLGLGYGHSTTLYSNNSGQNNASSILSLQ